MIPLDGIVRRLVAGALDARRDDELFGALCEDLVAAGIPLLRGAMGSQFLHPTMDVRLLRWVRDRGTEGHTFEREPDDAPEDQEWATSPLYHLKYRQEHLLHCRIDAASIAQFPLLGEFAEMGGTDYVALRQPIGRGRHVWRGERDLHILDHRPSIGLHRRGSSCSRSCNPSWCWR